MPETRYHKWMLLQTGQVAISEGYNRMVNALDTLLYVLEKVVARLGDGILEGLSINVTGNSIEVSSGIAISDGFPLLLTESVRLPKPPSKTFVCLKRESPLAGSAYLSPVPTDFVIAEVDGNEVRRVARSLLPFHTEGEVVPVVTSTQFPRPPSSLIINAAEGDIEVTLPDPAPYRGAIVIAQRVDNSQNRVKIADVDVPPEKGCILLATQTKWLKLNL